MKPAAHQSKNVAILAASQAPLLINNSPTIALNGLAGHALAADKALATLPVTLIFLTMATSSFSSGFLLERRGWATLNTIAIRLIAAIGTAVLWLMHRERAGATRCTIEG